MLSDDKHVTFLLRGTPNARHGNADLKHAPFSDEGHQLLGATPLGARPGSGWHCRKGARGSSVLRG
jgi:hypothetical protein